MRNSEFALQIIYTIFLMANIASLIVITIERHELYKQKQKLSELQFELITKIAEVDNIANALKEGEVNGVSIDKQGVDYCKRHVHKIQAEQFISD